MSKSKINFIICGFAFVILISGCATLFKKDAQTGIPALLEPSMMLKFADLPYPTGFKLLSKDSYTFESQGVRVAVLRYRGKANVDLVVNFYKEQMSMYNWALLNTVEYGERLLNFDRENETCIVSLLPKGGSVTITISIGPKTQIPRRSDKPVK
jgi:hypothetical protein